MATDDTRPEVDPEAGEPGRHDAEGIKASDTVRDFPWPSSAPSSPTALPGSSRPSSVSSPWLSPASAASGSAPTAPTRRPRPLGAEASPGLPTEDLSQGGVGPEDLHPTFLPDDPWGQTKSSWTPADAMADDSVWLAPTETAKPADPWARAPSPLPSSSPSPSAETAAETAAEAAAETAAEMATAASTRARTKVLERAMSAGAPASSSATRAFEFVHPRFGDDVPAAALERRLPRASALGGVELRIEPLSERLAPSGRRVEERYELLGEIGRGGMGRILKARDTEIGREVAIKALLGEAVSDRNIRRFWTEVRATGRLEHPAIIPVHDVGRLPTGELFYVMKKLSGCTLADVVQSLREGDEETVREFTRVRLLTVFQQIAYAVAFAHARGVTHRDIKPANIMVGGYGEAILLDWGLAKIGPSTDEGEAGDMRSAPLPSAQESANGTITGTPQYMSPEAAEGLQERVGPKSDVYGLGAVLYELLTLTPPYEDQGFVSTVVRVRQHQFDAPRARAPNAAISEALEDLCLGAMHVDPEQRPTAKALADEIGHILEGAKERERRIENARGLVREGRRATERWRTLKVSLQGTESEARRLAKSVAAWAPAESKASLWALEDKVSELKIEAIGAFEEAESAFLRALGEVSDDKEARSGLASLYFARFGEAERARDVEAQRYYRGLVSRFDDGVWSQVMEGEGSLEVTLTCGHESEVAIAPMELKGRALRPGLRRALGRGTVPRFNISVGSYLVSVSSPGEREIQCPVWVGRNEAMSVHVRCRRSEEVGDEYVLVPAGPAIVGGDTMAPGSLERYVAEVAEFAIARFPVTCAEYLEFLHALAAVDVEQARRRSPRARPLEGYFWTFDASSGRFAYGGGERGVEGSTWGDHLPVSGISLRDAAQFAAWRSEVTQQRLRLPHETEWEKAARGVDGRFFPWGDHFDPTFCKMRDSRNRPYPDPEPVGAFPMDCSPYGARDMAGGVRELCVTEDGGGMVAVVRGGGWLDTANFCRLAHRDLAKPDYVTLGLGFRLVREMADALDVAPLQG